MYFEQNEFGGLDLLQLSAFPERVCSEKGSEWAEGNPGLLLRALARGIFLQFSYFAQLILSAGVLSDYETGRRQSFPNNNIHVPWERWAED